MGKYISVLLPSVAK
ncbi:hypothetical protein YPPY64_4582, partial [Yersinia pestis PY-64]